VSGDKHAISDCCNFGLLRSARLMREIGCTICSENNSVHERSHTRHHSHTASARSMQSHARCR